MGGGLGGLGAVRSLARAGLRVIAMAERANDACLASRHAEPRKVSGEALVEALLRLRADTPPRTVLLFTADQPLMTVSRHRAELAGHYRFEMPPHDLLERLLAKEAFHQSARAHGFPVPESVIVREASDTDRLDRLMPPLALKPNRHSPAYDARFLKAYRLSTADEAKALCRGVLEVIDEVVVQEWIEGGNDAIHFTSQCHGGDGVASFTGRKIRSWPPNVGVAASCTAAEDAEAALAPLTARFFQAIGITRGLVSMEYKRDSRSGRFVMIEPTIARLNWQEEIATLCGVNLPLAAYCDALGLPLPEPRPDPRHVWRNELVDRAAAWRADQPYRLPPGRRVHNAYWRWDDPLPAVAVLREKMAKYLGGG